ncbi:glucose-6-phosphate isomerase [Methanocaldococcus indicus]|uniref:glucose-6-phosphate isomerase n=1 Tax=Methanocaldococcus indicus TaxID=213231 RepID=UPI003C6DB501
MDFFYENSLIYVHEEFNNFDFKKYIDSFEKKLKNDVGIRESIYNDYSYDFSSNKIVVVGMGGSILGTMTLYHSLNLEGSYFIDNSDPEKTLKIIKEIDDDTLIFVVSKSGNTLETLVNYQYIKRKCKNPKFIFITNGGKLKEIAKKENYPILNIPENVPGRYSVFTSVGLAPLSALNVNIKKILKGAIEIDKEIQKDYKNPAVLNGVIHYLNDLKGFDISVLFIYIERLKYFGEWYKQLLAESLGKDGKGITPLISLGAKDQHSILQLYLDGKKDKIVTFLSVKEYGEDDKVVLNGKELYLSDIIKSEQLATEKALTINNIPNLKIELNKIDEKNLGKLLYMYMYQVGFMGELYNVDAFNQPAVELEKKICWEIIEKL